MSDEECQESPAVLITSSEKGCWSYVGMLKNWKSQQLNLQSPGCDSVGTAIHEMGHALGMSHEQARPDRDEYVEIHASRIREGKKHNFDINPRGGKEAEELVCIRALADLKADIGKNAMGGSATIRVCIYIYNLCMCLYTYIYFYMDSWLLDPFPKSIANSCLHRQFLLARETCVEKLPPATRSEIVRQETCAEKRAPKACVDRYQLLLSATVCTMLLRLPDLFGPGSACRFDDLNGQSQR